MAKLDRGSIRSSPSNGLSTPIVIVKSKIDVLLEHDGLPHIPPLNVYLNLFFMVK